LFVFVELRVLHVQHHRSLNDAPLLFRRGRKIGSVDCYSAGRLGSATVVLFGNFIEDVLYQHQERFFYVAAVLGGSLEERQMELVCKLLNIQLS